MVSVKLNLSIPEDMKARYEKYQKEHPERPLNLSAILQTNLDRIMKEEGY